MSRPLRHFWGSRRLALGLFLGVLAPLLWAPPYARADDEFFEKQIRPILVERCQRCHGDKKQEGDLRLDSKPGWQTGGSRGAALVPGKPEASLLIRAVSYVDKEL